MSGVTGKPSVPAGITKPLFSKVFRLMLTHNKTPAKPPDEIQKTNIFDSSIILPPKAIINSVKEVFLPRVVAKNNITL